MATLRRLFERKKPKGPPPPEPVVMVPEVQENPDRPTLMVTIRMRHDATVNTHRYEAGKTYVVSVEEVNTLRSLGCL